MMNRHLLVVDNEPDIQMLLRIYFERQGFDVSFAHDGYMALDVAARICPDVILMDMQMPLMNGLEVTRLLRADARFSRTPIIAITAYPFAEVYKDAVEAGVDFTVIKPLDLLKLHNLIADVLTRAPVH